MVQVNTKVIFRAEVVVAVAITIHMGFAVVGRGLVKADIMAITITAIELKAAFVVSLH
jgi:hypothetical protein